MSGSIYTIEQIFDKVTSDYKRTVIEHFERNPLAYWTCDTTLDEAIKEWLHMNSTAIQSEVQEAHADKSIQQQWRQEEAQMLILQGIE